MNRKNPMVSFLVMTLMLMAVSLGMAHDYGLKENFQSGFERAETNAAPEQVDPIFGYQLILSEETASVDYCESEGLSYTLTLAPGVCIAMNDSIVIESPKYLDSGWRRESIGSVFSCMIPKGPAFSQCWLC